MITKDEIQELLHSTETYRVERTTSTDERSKGRGQTRLDYALQGGRRRDPTGDMDKFQEAICAFANDNGGNIGGKVGGENEGNVPVIELTERQRVILELISIDSTLSAKALSEKMSEKMSEKSSVNERTIERDIAKLKKLDYLRRIGGRKDGHWEVNIPLNSIGEIV